MAEFSSLCRRLRCLYFWNSAFGCFGFSSPRHHHLKMLIRIILCILCLAMIAVAISFQPSRTRSLLGSVSREGPHLRVMTWNIGHGDIENDSRAHTPDLKAVADTILSNDPDAVALQELTGPEQLKILLGHLHGKYSGGVAAPGTADRVEAVLV